MLRTQRLCPGDLNKRILDMTRARVRPAEMTERGIARTDSSDSASRMLALMLAVC
jgi:hypothetical protein